MPSPIFRLQRQVHQYQHEEMTKLTRRIRILGAAVVLVLGFIVASIALAAPASQPASQPAVQNVQQWWMPLLTPVIAALGTALAAFVTALIAKLLKMIEAKYKIDVPAEVEKLMAEKAKQLIAGAEEEAERRILHEDGQVTSGAVKSKQVVDALVKFAESIGYGKQYQEEQAKKLVDGVLHLSRTGSENVVGSNGERGKLLAKARNTSTSQR